MDVLWSRIPRLRAAPTDERQIRLLKECKDSMYKLDDAMVRLLMSLDSVHATAEMLVKYLNISDEHGDGSEDANQKVRDCMPVAARLLVMVERVICKEKQSSIESVSTFMKFIITNANVMFRCGSGEFRELVLTTDQYDRDIRQFNEEDSHIETILNENKTLKEVNDDRKRVLESLQIECQGLIEERNNSKKMIERLQNEITNLKKQVDNLNLEKKEHIEKQASVLKGKEENMNFLEGKNNILLTKCDDLENLNGNLKLELENVQQQMEALNAKSQQNLSTKDQEITVIRKREKDLEEHNINLKAVVSELKKENLSLQEHIENTVKQHNNSVAQKEEKIAEINNELKSLRQNMDEQQVTYNMTIREKEKEIGQMKISVSNYEEQIRSKEEQMKKYDEDRVSFQLEKTTLTEENTKLHAERNEYAERFANTEKDKTALLEKTLEQNDEIQTLRAELEEKASNLQALRNEVDQTKLHIQLVKKECDEKKSEVIILTNKYEEKNNELIKIMSKKTIQVQIYCQQKTGWTSDIEKELIDSLKFEMKAVDDKLELDFFKTSRPSDVLPEIPLLLICVTISRLGTDVINATQGLALTPNMALMIFHHKDEHALPNQASERVLTAKELRTAGGIFDMAFKSTSGIYSCDMNSNTISSLITFIRRKAT